jgi:hypothetical protein
MKTIAQLYAERLAAAQLARNGMLSPQDSLRLELHSCFDYWVSILTLLDPLGRQRRLIFGVEGLFDRRGPGLKDHEAGMGLLKAHLGVARISCGTYFKVVEVLRDACRLALTRDDADLALCAFLVFMQLELGGVPDSHYGDWPMNKETHVRPFNDADLPDELAVEILEARHDTSEDFGTSDYNAMMWFRKWEEIIGDAEQFERKFPGMGYRRENLARALKPIFQHLDPVGGSWTLELCLRWAKLLLRSHLQEDLVGPEPNNTAAEPEIQAAA